ncbi:uncharacterized protein TRIVIDRAFT_66661 [Trichoderma virens Gv29-8]|uniref:Uncharacterized protein n=1 Tax=Hypocrea virens (strain Gv29-8 / FGSC 10586) TaxID=413071 RepID=G9N6K0_HYPVG|nr:uncharacterized protein TRIVIDRAFT_66661 [Trichoderma virens Gv29-8]EHK17760.1 hypothetical protein TRIVIDRAFT_66661 [Trichoderma virens Gv29-8]UKZ53525.1 hypothetical protein TrVGV298_007317 [Trichoderma virens]
MVGNEPIGVNFKKVPKEEVAALEAQGWEVYSVMTKSDWRPGQLIGQNGSDPATLAKSPSFAPPDRHKEATDRRSATSTGHVLLYQRPAGVCAGWGGYDDYTQWQSFGRRIHKDMVEKQEWSTDPMKPVQFVDESGEVAQTITIPFDREDLPSQPRNLASLYDKLNPTDSQKPRAAKRKKTWQIVESKKPRQQL